MKINCYVDDRKDREVQILPGRLLVLVWYLDYRGMDNSQTSRANMNLIEVLPAFGVVVTLVGVGIKAGMVLKTLEHAVQDIAEVKSEIREIKKQLNDLNVRVAKLEARQ